MTSRIFITFFIFFLIHVWLPLIAQDLDEENYTERRLALVIGNAAYEDAPLKNPVNDADAIAAQQRYF